MKQAERVLATGKNINFLKDVCQNAKGYDGRNQIKSLLERSPGKLKIAQSTVLRLALNK